MSISHHYPINFIHKTELSRQVESCGDSMLCKTIMLTMPKFAACNILNLAHVQSFWWKYAATSGSPTAFTHHQIVFVDRAMAHSHYCFFCPRARLNE